MTPWMTLVAWILGIIGSGTINLLVIGYYIGKYQGDLRDAIRRLDDLEDEKKQERKDDVGVRERLRYLEAKTNMIGWRKEH
jgi:hypothetical protein